MKHLRPKSDELNGEEHSDTDIGCYRQLESLLIAPISLCVQIQIQACQQRSISFWAFDGIKLKTEENDIEKNICSCWICSIKMLPCLSLLLKAMPHFDNVTQTNDCCIFPPDTMSICMPRASWFNPYRKKRPDINFEILSPIDKMRIRNFFFFYRKIKLKA